MSTIYGPPGERLGQRVAPLVGDIANLARRFGMTNRQQCPIGVGITGLGEKKCRRTSLNSMSGPGQAVRQCSSATDCCSVSVKAVRSRIPSWLAAATNAAYCDGPPKERTTRLMTSRYSGTA